MKNAIDKMNEDHADPKLTRHVVPAKEWMKDWNARYPSGEKAEVRKSPLPPTNENNVRVHLTHCCREHGCKYNDPDCPVESGNLAQEYPCESCERQAVTGEDEDLWREIHKESNESHNFRHTGAFRRYNFIEWLRSNYSIKRK